MADLERIKRDTKLERIKRDTKLERIKCDIKKIAQQPAATRFREIERVVRQLGETEYDVSSRRTNETYLFRVGDQRWSVCRHNRTDSKAVEINRF